MAREEPTSRYRLNSRWTALIVARLHRDVYDVVNGVAMGPATAGCSRRSSCIRLRIEDSIEALAVFSLIPAAIGQESLGTIVPDQESKLF